MPRNLVSFGEVIEALRHGHRATRLGWNGKDMWIAMTPGKMLYVDVHDIWTDNIKEVAVENGGEVEILPYLTMKTADNKIVIGWLASQTDMISTDWIILD